MYFFELVCIFLLILFSEVHATAHRNYGIKVNLEEEALEEINKELLDDPDYAEVEDLADHLETFKKMFLEFEKDAEGNIDLVGLSHMLEKVGQPKTHLEMKKMIREIDTTNKGTICYRDFIAMMLGPKSSELKLKELGRGKADRGPSKEGFGKFAMEIDNI